MLCTMFGVNATPRVLKRMYALEQEFPIFPPTPVLQDFYTLYDVKLK